MTDIILQQHGMGMTSAIITEWRKAVGDRVERGEIILEVEAAKATIEIESPADGILTEILVQEEEEVPILTVLGRVE